MGRDLDGNPTWDCDSPAPFRIVKVWWSLSWPDQTWGLIRQPHTAATNMTCVYQLVIAGQRRGHPRPNYSTLDAAKAACYLAWAKVQLARLP